MTADGELREPLIEPPFEFDFLGQDMALDGVLGCRIDPLCLGRNESASLVGYASF